MATQAVAQDEVERARSYAEKTLRGQYLKGRKRQSRLEHAAEVSILVKLGGGNAKTQVVGMIHEIISHTNTSLPNLVERFGQEIIQTVLEVTEPDDWHFITEFGRKQKLARRIASSSSSAKLVQLANEISEVRSLVNDPPIGWGTVRCLESVEGSRLLAQACEGTSALLTATFIETYYETLGKYGVVHFQAFEGALCGFSGKPLKEWPLGQTLAPEQVFVTCPKCLAPPE